MRRGPRPAAVEREENTAIAGEDNSGVAKGVSEEDGDPEPPRWEAVGFLQREDSKSARQGRWDRRRSTVAWGFSAGDRDPF